MEEITVIKIYDDLPIIVKSDDGKIYQLNYYDRVGRFRKFKILEPKQHNGSVYYRIDGVRYSEYKLMSMEIRRIKKINLNKKIVRWRN